MIFQSDSPVVSLEAATVFLTSVHRFSIEYRSVDCAGHSKTFTEFISKHCVVFLLIYLESLTCWKTHTNDISLLHRIASQHPKYRRKRNSPLCFRSNALGLLHNKKSKPILCSTVHI